MSRCIGVDIADCAVECRLEDEAPTGTGSSVRAARAREAEAPKRLERSSELGAFAAQSGTEDRPPIEEVSEYLTRIMDAEPQSRGSVSSAYRSSQGLLGRELERRVRIELMAVRISGAMPGCVRQRAFDDMADAGTTSGRALFELPWIRSASGVSGESPGLERAGRAWRRRTPGRSDSGVPRAVERRRDGPRGGAESLDDDSRKGAPDSAGATVPGETGPDSDGRDGSIS